LIGLICDRENAIDGAVAVKLLHLLESVKTVDLWLESVSAFRQILSDLIIGNKRQFAPKLLSGLVIHYLDVSKTAVKKSKSGVSKEFTSAIMSVLTSEKKHLPHLEELQLNTLSHLTLDYFCALDEVSQHSLVRTLLK
jgi:hypothetical protein